MCCLKLLETFPDTDLLSASFSSFLVANRCSQAYQKLRVAHPMLCSPGTRDKVEMVALLHYLHQAARQLGCASLTPYMTELGTLSGTSRSMAYETKRDSFSPASLIRRTYTCITVGNSSCAICRASDRCACPSPQDNQRRQGTCLQE